MTQQFRPVAVFAAGAILSGLLVAARSGEPAGGQAKPGDEAPGPGGRGGPASEPVPADRPEQKLTEHDKSDKFDPKKPAPLTPALKDQPNGRAGSPGSTSPATRSAPTSRSRPSTR